MKNTIKNIKKKYNTKQANKILLQNSFPFFLIHMGIFGSSGFFLAYSETPYMMCLMHGGIAIFVYIVFYLSIFGLDKIIWMIINAIISIIQIKFIIIFIVNFFITDFSFENYPLYRHIIPGIYIVLYIFLLRQFIKYIFKKSTIANIIFLTINLLFFLFQVI